MIVKREFFKCNSCGNLISLVEKGGGTLTCCGQPMQHLAPNTQEAATEKHIPVAKREGNLLTVKVGEVMHPQTVEHHISFIALAQGNHTQIATLPKEGVPEVVFHVGNGSITLYADCNLHGLWGADVVEEMKMENEICSAEFSGGCENPYV